MKKIFIFSTILIVILLLIGILFISKNKNPTPLPNSFFPTVTPISIPKHSIIPLEIIDISPKEYTTQLPPTQQLIITFNKALDAKQISYNISPSIKLSLQAKDNVLTFTPVQKYEPNVLYTLIVSDSSSNHLLTKLHFSSGNTPSVVPMQDQNIRQDVNSFDKISHPDVFLTNQTPYSTKAFSISSHYVDGTPYGHYGFIVRQDDSNAKQAFLNWLTSLGLTNSQVQNLDITYQ